MRTLNSLILLALLSVSAANAQADVSAAVPPPPATTSATANPTPKPAVDPTQAFFRALVTCSPGAYLEKNVLSASVGGDMLSHRIEGMDKNQLCEVTLGTPDGRSMDCNFKPDDLSALSEPHFISGILSDTIDDPSDEAVRADELWNGLKAASCSF